MCRHCLPGRGCFKPENPKIYTVEGYGTVKGEQNMMQEIYQRGP